MSAALASLQAAEQLITAAIEHELQQACEHFGLASAAASRDSEALQYATNAAANHMRGYLAGLDLAAREILPALVRDGFLAQSTRPSEALYLLEAIAALPTKKPAIEMEINIEGRVLQ